MDLPLGDARVLEPHAYRLDDGTADIDLYTLGAYGNGKAVVSEDIAIVYNATVDAQLGHEYRSGDDDSKDQSRAAFDTLLATNQTPGITPDKRRFGGHQDLGEELFVWALHTYTANLDFRAGNRFFVPGEGMKARFQAQDVARGVAVESHGSVALGVSPGQPGALTCSQGCCPPLRR